MTKLINSKMILSSYSAARASGIKHYFTGKPCKHGHVEPRLASTGQCMECSRIRATTAYWKNPELARAKSASSRTPEKSAASFKVWQAANVDCRKAYRAGRKVENAALAKAKYARDGDKARVSGRESMRRRKAKVVEYRKNNSFLIASYTANRRASKLQATPCWFSELDALVMREAQELRKLRFEATSIRWEVDHSIPLRSKWASGLHCAANIQVIPKSLNNTKSSRNVYTEPYSWLQTL